MRIEIEAYGRKYTYEEKADDLTISDMLEIYRGLLQSMGYCIKPNQELVLEEEEWGTNQEEISH